MRRWRGDGGRAVGLPRQSALRVYLDPLFKQNIYFLNHITHIYTYRGLHINLEIAIDLLPVYPGLLSIAN